MITISGNKMAASASQQCPPSTDEHFTKGRFSSRVAIVTGGASGIGQATVNRFANDGARVIIFDINKELGEKVATTLTDAGHMVEFMTVDVSDKDQCLQAVSKVADKFGKINYLVNCAAYFGCKGVTIKPEDWHKTMIVNVQGYSNMVQACHPHMTKAMLGERAIVNMASLSAHRAQPSHWNYSASKGAIVTLTKCMALDLAVDGIRVNSVSPGWIFTPEVAKAAGSDLATWEQVWGDFHMQRRLGEPAEVAAAVTYLCSRDASFITAVDLPVDGGYLGMSAEGLGKNSKFAGSGD